MIASSRGGRAMEDAIALLAAGGNAADAALSLAIAQIVYAAGYWTTFAGVLTLVYFDAASGKVSSLNAGFDTPAGEIDPMSIPRIKSMDDPVPNDIGRTVLVPGFMAGLEAAHRRFGTIPFSRLFDSGIAMAEDGMIVTAGLVESIGKPALNRLPAGKALFNKPDGRPYAVGEVFRQPALAETLRRVAAEGAAYMYGGAWAKKFVDAVQAEGGRIDLDDLARYRPQWAEPIHSHYHGYDVYSLHQCHFMHGGLRLAQEARLAEMGRYYENPDVFFHYHRIFRATGTNMSIMGPRIDELAVPPADWLDDAKIKVYWPAIRDGHFPPAPGGENNPHTDCLVVVDTQGNVASLMHSTNGAMTGIYVDGISVPAPAGRQQNHLRKVGPGKPLPNMVPNTIVLKDGRPAFVTAAAGNALHQETIKVLTNLIDYGKAGREAIQAASFVEPYFSDETGIDPDEIVLRGDYSGELLDAVRAKGMAVTEVDRGTATGGANAEVGKPAQSSQGLTELADGEDHRHGANIGVIALIAIDPETGEREGVSSRFGGDARGY